MKKFIEESYLLKNPGSSAIILVIFHLSGAGLGLGIILCLLLRHRDENP
jgi:hypothetical protein